MWKNINLIPEQAKDGDDTTAWFVKNATFWSHGVSDGASLAVRVKTLFNVCVYWNK